MQRKKEDRKNIHKIVHRHSLCQLMADFDFLGGISAVSECSIINTLLL